MDRQDNIEISYNLYTVISAGIFLFLAGLHSLRAYYQWDLILNTWSVPIWVSWLIVLVTFLMSITAIRKLR